MTKHFFSFLFFFSICFSVYGLGGGTENTDPNQPKENFTAKNFTAKIFDGDNKEVTINNVRWKNNFFIEANYGKGKVNVNFENIEQIIINSSVKKRNITAVFFLKDGKEIEVSINGNSKIYGVSSLGDYNILLRHIKKIEFQTP